MNVRLRCNVIGSCGYSTVLYHRQKSFGYACERSRVGLYHDRWLPHRTPPSPVFMGCATKNAKVITIALSSLQRLIALHAVSLSAIPAVIQTMNDYMSQGVDIQIQLKILQTLLSLVTNFPTIHG
jgi:hypothetical protein